MDKRTARQEEREEGRLTEGYAACPSFEDPGVRARVTGRAYYGRDLLFPGLLYGRILRSPHSHARLEAVHTSRAHAVEGLRAVLTGAQITAGPFGVALADEHILARDRVRYIGDEVAAVAATSPAAAARALEVMEVDYSPLPAVFDPLKALAPGAPLVHEETPGNVAVERNLERGDAAAAFREAACVVSRTYTFPPIHPAYLEPLHCVALFEADGSLTLHTALQSPDIVRSLLAPLLGIPLSRLRIVCPAMGGGFGGKVYGNLKLYLLAALLSRKTGRPVSMELSRQEEFTAGRPLVAGRITLTMALDSEGRFLAREADIIADNGAYSAQGPWVIRTMSERNDSVYRFGALRTRVRLVYTNKVPTGQYRAYGNQVANFACENLIDEAARKMGIDPLELRLRNCVRPGDTTAQGLQIGSCALDQCLRRAADLVGWDRRRPGRGYGLAAAIHASGTLVTDPDFRGAAARAHLELDGRVTIYSGEQDYGQGTHAAYARIAARTLKLDPGAVTLRSADTAVTPYSQGAIANRQATIGGRAVQTVAENLRAAIEEQASRLAGEKMTLLPGGILKGASGRVVDLPAVALDYHRQTSGLTLGAEGSYVPPPADYGADGYGNIAVTYSFAAHAAEVSVDRETGALTVHRIVAVHDSGQIIDRTAAEGQVFGGVVQGLGLACYEGYLFAGGRVANATLAGHHQPTTLDVPPITCRFVETDDPAGPYGAKGLGEIVQVPVVGALGNAVADAVGAPVCDLPLTAEKIYRALNSP